MYLLINGLQITMCSCNRQLVLAEETPEKIRCLLREANGDKTYGLKAWSLFFQNMLVVKFPYDGSQGSGCSKLSALLMNPFSKNSKL